MKYFYIEPEVAGGLGKNTEFDRSVHPPMIRKLHYEFDGWLGDALLESTPCFIITYLGVQRIQAAQFTGVSFREVSITTSNEFKELYPDTQLPKFSWLKVEGRIGFDDFGNASDGRLVVSARALELLREIGISHASVEPLA